MANKKLIILLVEDDEVLLRALYILFHNKKYTIATASDGDTAFKMAQKLHPDVILLDLLLPKMNGLEVLKNLKADPAVKDIPVIILSNLGDNENMETAKSLGAINYFVKSDTNLESLAKEVEKTLE